MSRTNLLLCFCVSAGLLCIVGCGNGDSGATNAPTVPVEERVKAIEARTDMPPQAKAMAIQQMKGREAASQQGAGVGQKPGAQPPK